MAENQSAYRAERQALNATIESLTDEELLHGTTLCGGWAPRDVMAHLIGIDRSLFSYIKAFGSTKKGNADLVAKYASLDAPELRAAVKKWSEEPAFHALAVQGFLLGDLGIHHQDILRGLGKTREVPEHISKAIFREGIILGGFLKLRHNRLVPTDGGSPRGKGPEIKGTTEALGLWLSGRKGLENELSFSA